MSKSLGNYIGVTEPPGEMFGKTMSISDALMERHYYPLLLGEDFPPMMHPMEAKKSLWRRGSWRGTTRNPDAQAARADFEQRFSKRDNENADLPGVKLNGRRDFDLVTAVISAYEQAFQHGRNHAATPDA